MTDISDRSTDFSSNFNFANKNLPEGKTEISYYFINVVKKHLESATW